MINGSEQVFGEHNQIIQESTIQNKKSTRWIISNHSEISIHPFM